MRLTISGHHVEVTDGLKTHLKKLRRVQRDTIDRINLFWLWSGLSLSRADLPRRINFFASETLSDMHPAIDSVIDNDRQVTDHDVNELTKALIGSSDVYGRYILKRPAVAGLLIYMGLVYMQCAYLWYSKRETNIMRILIVGGTSGSGKVQP